MVNAFSKACGKPINYHFAPRRDGDLPAYWADASKADRELNWRVTRTLDEMAQDTGTGSHAIRRDTQIKDVVMTPFNPIDHPHRRYNPLTGQWVLVSPHRAKRPGRAQETPSQQMLPAHDPTASCVRAIRVSPAIKIPITKGLTSLLTISQR